MLEFIKICGVTRPADAVAATRLGATHIGLVFFPKSPRRVDLATAEEIVLTLKEAAFDEGREMPALVGLFVDAAEKAIAEAAPLLTHLQLHGRESPDRCRTLAGDFGLNVIKALPIATAEDAAAAGAYAGVVDQLLFDAKPPPGAERPGGHGLAFDWSLLRAYAGDTPFFLAGGLSPDNVGAAITAARENPAFIGVDVSSGVESAPGRKDHALLARFISAAKGAAAAL